MDLANDLVRRSLLVQCFDELAGLSHLLVLSCLDGNGGINEELMMLHDMYGKTTKKGG